MIRVTPVIAGGAQLGARVALKLENLQRTGSFKLRGAVRAVAALSAAQRAVGVVAASAGSHGAAMALTCARAGVRCTVVVSEAAPMVKRAAIERLGAELLVRGAGYDQAEAAAIALAAERGARFVSPFDDDDVIAGNGGDLAAEILAQVPDLARVLVAVGGGGMAGGLGAALAPRGVSMVGVQPEANCAMYHALAHGGPVADYRGGPTLADALAGDAVARRNYDLCARHLESIALVSEADIRAAIAYLYREVGTVAEPSGAAAVAGLLAGAAAPAGRGTTLAIVSGGNIEPDLLDQILAPPGAPA
ncbi:MAG TPA: pyridoxal-phosphate dependent enzyme [Kofleriaceae bacterium]|nr:pyridoxal-phosphate dependent enzyme [Kofleriaceae bacterium]